jgi:predicted enzyme related to lactoylglutathione lyase
MILQIATQAVYVSDQAAAEKFWTARVGFELRAKHQMGNGLFWLEVAPRGAQTCLVIYPRSLMADWQTRRPSIVFICDNLEETHSEMRARGVEIGMPPTKMKWGTFASFRDPDGNEFLFKSA